MRSVMVALALAMATTAAGQPVPEPSVTISWSFIDENLNPVTRLNVGQRAFAVATLTLDGFARYAQTFRSDVNVSLLGLTTLGVLFNGPGSFDPLPLTGAELGYSNGLRGVSGDSQLPFSDGLRTAYFVGIGGLGDILFFGADEEPATFVWGGFEIVAEGEGTFEVDVRGALIFAGSFVGQRRANGTWNVRLDQDNSVAFDLEDGYDRGSELGRFTYVPGTIQIVPAPAVVGAMGVGVIIASRRRR